MKTIDFVVRPRVGAVERGVVGDDATGFAISGRPGAEMSLNLRQADLRGFDRAGDDLLITLADGRVIVAGGYMNDDKPQCAQGQYYYWRVAIPRYKRYYDR